MTYEIYINENLIAEVSGVEAAWNAFEMANALADTIGGKVKMVENRRMVVARHFTFEKAVAR